MSRLGKLEFRELTSADEQQAIDAHQALLKDDFQFLPSWSPEEHWDDYVYRMRAGRRGENIPEGWVRSALFVGLDDGFIVGRVSIRYELNDSLLQLGGHLGYGVIPESRRLGAAEQLCRFGLGELAEAGIQRALITCDATNVGSTRTILKSGGVPDLLEPEVYDSSGIKELRFWAPTS